MRVSAINRNYNNSSINSKTINKTTFRRSELKNPAMDKAAFTGIKDFSLTKLASFKIPCMYCGRPTLDGSKYTRLTSRGIFEQPVRKILPILDEFKDSFHPIELKVLNMLQNQAQNFPNLNIQELLQIAAPKHAKKLVIKQLPIFNNILDIGKELPKDKYNSLYEIVNRTVGEVIEGYKDCTYSNIGFINKITPLVFDQSGSILERAFQDECMKLPSSHQNFSAFIAKYARTNSDRIAFSMGEPSFFSKEDVVPRFLNGIPGFGNYGIACKGDNAGFGHTLMEDRIKMRPETIENTQKQIKFMIDLVNKGELPAVIVENMANLYEKHMGNSIKFDLSKLDYDKYNKERLNHSLAQCFYNKLSKFGLNNVSIPQEYTFFNNCNKVKHTAVS